MKVILSLGSNCGNRLEHVENAISYLRAEMADVRVSRLYETPEIQGVGNPYINAVMSGDTSMDYDSFNSKLKQFELSEGRDARCRMRGDVPIDIDIVIADGRIVRPKDYAQSFFSIGYGELNLE